MPPLWRHAALSNQMPNITDMDSVPRPAPDSGQGKTPGSHTVDEMLEMSSMGSKVCRFARSNLRVNTKFRCGC